MQTEQLDLRKVAARYVPTTPGEMEVVDIPPFPYLMVDGTGDPETSVAFSAALNWLYGVSYRLKFAAKAQGRDFHVGSLEGLWRAEALDDFRAGRRNRWGWTIMIMQPDFVLADDVAAAVSAISGKLGQPPATLRLAEYADGLCAQVLHVGPFSEEGPVIAQLHGQFLPSQQLQARGDHHEIYLADPRRVQPSKMRTVLRQPVRRLVQDGASGQIVDKTATLA